MNIPQEELDYFAFAERKIATELAERNAGHEEIQKDLYEKRKYLWQEMVGSERGAQDRYEEANQKSDIKAGEKFLDEAALQIMRLKRLQQTPYFARIDFKEPGFPEEALYIGKFGLTDMKTYEAVICDWRSDIASMYYNYTPGPASYHCEIGEIEGVMTRKRQFQVERGKLIGCFDTALSIEDYFLQKILSAHAGSSMKTIVDSIQEKQNDIIRESDAPIVLINGCAGSGKTSIALHRIAYQLYRSRKTLKASDCMIFSPNNLFEDYIASVLPDLGEDNVWQTTFADFASEIFGRDWTVHSYIETLAAHNDRKLEAKGAAAFAEKLRAVCERFEAGRCFSDFVMEDELICSAEAQKELFSGYRESLNYTQSYNRLKAAVLNQSFQNRKALRTKIAERLVREKGERYYLSEHEKMAEARLETIRMTQEWENSFRDALWPDVFALYAALLAECFGESERERFEADCGKKVLLFEDATPLLYLMRCLGRLGTQEKMRQIVIDEAQDYTDLQYILLLEMYPHARFTILGDSEQALSGSGSFWQSVANATDKVCKQFELRVNYRSSREIVEFTNRLMGKQLCEAIDRSGGEVLEWEGTREALTEPLQKFLDGGEEGQLMAVVCADAESAERIFKQIHRPDCCLLKHEFASRNRSICVLPVYLAKGLEFDRVAVINEQNALTNGKLYVACTRALHELAVFSVKK